MKIGSVKAGHTGWATERMKATDFSFKICGSRREVEGTFVPSFIN